MMTSRVPRLVGCKVASWAESVIILLLRAWLLSFCGHACALRWAVGAWARLGAWAPSLVCGGFARRHFFSYPFTLAGACMYVPLAPAAGRKEGTRINTDSRAPPAPQDDRTQHIPSTSTRRTACVVHQLRHSSDDVRCAALHEMGKLAAAAAAEHPATNHVPGHVHAHGVHVHVVHIKGRRRPTCRLYKNRPAGFTQQNHPESHVHVHMHAGTIHQLHQAK